MLNMFLKAKLRTLMKLVTRAFSRLPARIPGTLGHGEEKRDQVGEPLLPS